MILRIAIAAAAVGCASVATATDRLVTLEGDVLEGAVTEIATDAGVVIDGRRIDFEGLRSILPRIDGSPSEPELPVIEVTLVCGSTLPAKSVLLADEEFTVDVPVVGTRAYPIDVVRALRLQDEREDSRYHKAMRELDDERDKDTFFFLQKGELLEENGLIEVIDPESLAYDRGEDKGVEDVLRSDVYGIVLASPLDIEAEKRPYKVTLAGGARFHTDWLAREENNLRMRIIGDEEIAVPWESVRGIVVHSSRLVFLSDLNPTEVREQAILAPVRSWQRDRSVSQRPLMVGNQRFEKGLGFSSGMELTWAADDYDRFVATIGLNAETGERGDCEFVVRAGERELFRQRVSGGDAPRVIRVDLAGVESVTLAVEPGVNLDLADHAEWGDACMLELK